MRSVTSYEFPIQNEQCQKRNLNEFLHMNKLALLIHPETYSLYIVTQLKRYKFSEQRTFTVSLSFFPCYAAGNFDTSKSSK